jgi:hypothetical protein
MSAKERAHMRIDPSFTQTVVAAREQVSCDLGGESVILGLKTGVYYGINPMGTFIWNLIQEPIKINGIRDHILKEFEVKSDQCERDLVELLEALWANGLIECTDEKGA